MNFKRAVIIFFSGIAIMVGLYFLMDLLITTDEEKIEAIIDESKIGLEAEDPVAATKYLSNDYQDVYGLSKDKLMEIGENVFAKFDDFKVIIEKIEYDIQEKTATSKISFRIFMTYNGQRTFLFGDLNRPAHVTMIFEKTEANDTNWEIVGMKDLETRWPIGVYRK